MAKHQSKESLVKSLRAGGMRKKVARAVAEAAGGQGKSETHFARRTATRMRAAADRLEEQIRDTTRTQAAQKAARTRKRRADERSAAARKGARARSAKHS